MEVDVSELVKDEYFAAVLGALEQQVSFAMQTKENLLCLFRGVCFGCACVQLVFANPIVSVCRVLNQSKSM